MNTVVKFACFEPNAFCFKPDELDIAAQWGDYIVRYPDADPIQPKSDKNSRRYVAGELIDAGMAVCLGEDGLVYRSDMREPAPRVRKRVKKGDEVAIPYIPKAAVSPIKS